MKFFKTKAMKQVLAVNVKLKEDIEEKEINLDELTKQKVWKICILNYLKDYQTLTLS